MMEYLTIGLLSVIVIGLVLVLYKLHQMPAALGMVKSGASSVVADIEAVIAKHKSTPTPPPTPPAA